MIELKSTLNSNFEIGHNGTLQKNFETNNFLKG